MRSAVINNPRDIKIIEVNKPEINDKEVLIRLLGCGICGSNIPVFEGREWFKYPLEPGSPGHEGWGVVEELGSAVQNLRKGDLVTAITYHAFAEYDLAEETSLIKLPDSFNNTYFPGEPFGCAVNIYKRSAIKKDDLVAIVGVGFIGSLLIPLIKSIGAKVIAVSRKNSSLKIAETLGADFIIPFDDYWRIVDKVKKITNNNLCDVVIEAAGFQNPLDLAGDLTKTRGRLVIAGYHQDGLRHINMQMWNWKGIDVINAHERDQQIYIEGIKEAVNYVQEGIINPNDLFTHVFSLNEIKRGFEVSEQRPEGFVKSIITFN